MKKLTDIKELKLKATDVREDIVRMLHEAQSGHSAGPLGMADIFTALFFNVANIRPDKLDWPDRDRILLSNGHICPVLYSVMARSGYFPVEELLTLRNTAKVVGDIYTSKLAIEPGAVFTGLCNMNSGAQNNSLQKEKVVDSKE